MVVTDLEETCFEVAGLEEMDAEVGDVEGETCAEVSDLEVEICFEVGGLEEEMCFEVGV